ncbi:MAG: hypothetical protein JWP70_1431 [Leifsonia sp.]|jgi:hypothetical protein|nr:hypothetical protein [Leifsonia sp.]MDQ1589099.1 hypothetical protein [Microbacteriaceae bacterium]
MSHAMDHDRNPRSSTEQRNVENDSNKNVSHEETPYEETSFEDADRETHDSPDSSDSSRPGDIPFDQAVTEYENPELG